jgi:hypothetical protein
MITPAERVLLSMIIRAEDEASDTIEHIGGSLDKLFHTGLQMLQWTVAYQSLHDITSAVSDFGTGLITSNTQLEEFNQSLAILYHNTQEAQQASNWLTQFAVNAPDTLQNIRQASLGLVAVGADLVQVMPAIGNAAAAMGTTTIVASNALVRAFEGDFRIMRDQLHITAEQLVPFGLEMDRTGHVIASTVIPAFEKFVQQNYGDAMSKQIHTLSGVWSNLQDIMERFQQEAGLQAFDLLRDKLTGLYNYLDQNRDKVAAFGDILGSAVAGGVDRAIQAFEFLLMETPRVINAVVAAWHGLQAPLAIVGTNIQLVFQAVGNYLQKEVVPALEFVLGYAITWWNIHGADVARVVTNLVKNFQSFATESGKIFADYFKWLGALWEISWGGLEAIVATFLVNSDKNNARWRAAQLDGWTTFLFGLVDAAGAAIRLMIDLLTSQSLNKAFYNLSYMIAQTIVDGFGVLVNGVEHMVNFVRQKIDDLFITAINLYNKLPRLPGVDPLSNAPPIHVNTEAEMQRLAQDNVRRMQGALVGAYSPPAATNQTAIDIAKANINAAIAGTKQDIMGGKGQIIALGGGEYAYVLDPNSNQNVNSLFHYSRTQLTQKGKDSVDNWLKQFDKIINAPIDIGYEGVKGPGTGKVTSLPAPFGAGFEDQTAARRALDAAVSQAKEQFELDRINGAGMSKLMSDIANILKAMKADGATRLDMDLERARDLQAISKHTQSTAEHLASIVQRGQRQQYQELGFGSVVASFGVLTRDTTLQLVAALEAQNEMLRQQLDAALTVVRNTGRMTDYLAVISHSGGGGATGSAVRAQGVTPHPH